MLANANIAIVGEFVVVILVCGWAGMIVVAVAAKRLATDPDDLRTGMARLGLMAYSASLHRTSWVDEGERLELPASRPLLIVANHASGVDPLLIQAACPYFIRWMMAADMRWPELGALWRFGRVIFVDRRDGGSAGLRMAIQALRARDVVGIFPEGGLERPQGVILPFHEGVGVLIRRSKAIVQPVIVEQAPDAPTARAALWTPSKARLRFMPRIDYAGSGASSAEIAADLQARFLEWTGWPEGERLTMDEDAPR